MFSALPPKADVLDSVDLPVWSTTGPLLLSASVTLPDPQLGAGSGHDLAGTINEFGLG
jgi:hypothetical protein